MHNGFYKELDELKDDLGEDCDFGFLENELISDEVVAYDFLHGFCDIFAVVLKDIFNYDIECIDGKDGLVHAYCKKEINGEVFFIDVRGITNDYKEFIEEFDFSLEYFGIPNYPLDGTRNMEYIISKNENFLKYEKLARELISNYKTYYEI